MSCNQPKAPQLPAPTDDVVCGSCIVQRVSTASCGSALRLQVSHAMTTGRRQRVKRRQRSRTSWTRGARLFDAALAARAAGDGREATRLARACCAQLERSAGNHHPDLANACILLSSLAAAASEFGKAERYAARACAIMSAFDRDACAEQTALAVLRVRAWVVCAVCDRIAGRYCEAGRTLGTALAFADELLDAHDPERASVLNALGVLHKSQGLYDRAERAYAQARALIEAQAELDHETLASIYHNLGGLAHARGDAASGEPLARKAVQLRTNRLGSEHPDVAADEAALAAIAPLTLVLAVGVLAVPLALQRPLLVRDLKLQTLGGALSRFYLDALLGMSRSSRTAPR